MPGQTAAVSHTFLAAIARQATESIQLYGSTAAFKFLMIVSQRRTWMRKGRERSERFIIAVLFSQQ
ncbi:hypothetical protein D918_08370 [Trichuris suis]|nr:hypothetical protein D918_08370 [Trichuris suis]